MKDKVRGKTLRAYSIKTYIPQPPTELEEMVLFKELILQYIAQYGYIVLFLAFVLELLALPLPGETIMFFVGFLTIQGKMGYATSILVVWLGVFTGITIAYFLGMKLGSPFFHKYGSYFHLGPQRFDTASHWFEKYGGKVLIVAYFVPGIRHVTGYLFGIMEKPLRRFIFPAYLGAFLYAVIFISLGRILGSEWEHFHDLPLKYVILIGVIATVTFIVIYFWQVYVSQKNSRKH